MRRPGFVLAVPLCSALILAACGSSLVVRKSTAVGVKTVDIELANSGCVPAALSLPAGPTNFVVTNKGATAVSEFEIHEGTNILAEAELVTPGLEKSFAITLSPGKFTTLCTGGTRNHGNGTLTVTGHAAAARVIPLTAAETKAVATYRAYLESQAALLVARTTTFVHAVQAGEIARAKSLYAPARTPYERIEPVARTFADLNPRIDALVNAVPNAHWSGFHRIERALYQEDDVDAMGPTAAQLLADVTTLEHGIRTVRLEPATIANGAVELLNEVTTAKIAGTEEQYSHIDLVDLAANVQGAQAAFDAVAPLLPAHGSISAVVIDARFRAIYAVLKPLQRGSGYILFDQLTTTESRAIVQATDAAAEPLSQVPTKIIG